MTEPRQQSSLTIFTRAAEMLAQADTIQKAHELKDLALTAADWARRKGMGEEAIQYARSYALEAERRMGEMLAATERDKGGRPSETSNSTLPVSPPTLAEIGVTKRASAAAQKLAALPPEQFEAVKTGEKTRIQVSREAKEEQETAALLDAQKEIAEDKRNGLASVCDLRVCSCAELFASGIKPDAVITDPPYPGEFLPVFSELAKACKDAAVPLVAVMSGQTHLPEVMRRLCEHLTYRWTLAYLTPGGQSVQQFPVKVNTFWKPILLFGEAGEWFGDVCNSKVNDNDKRFHAWGQSESGMADLVSRLTKPGQLVCDPFLGGGTTAVVALSLGRRFIGCDTDGEMIGAAMRRCEAVDA